MADTPDSSITLSEGWHVLHQFYRFDAGAWAGTGGTAAQLRAGIGKAAAAFRASKDSQVLFFSVVGRADFGVMAVSAELNHLDAFEKGLRRAFGPGVADVDDSFFSVTEESEYTTSDEEYGESLVTGEKLEKGSPAFEEKMKAFKERMAKYRHERIYPKLGGWKAICFYPMAKRRIPDANWYALSYQDRRELMGGHARVGRTYAGRVKQLITGGTGLSDWEWGVTLFSNQVDELKKIVYEMRFDEVSHRYGEFGPFHVGILMDEEALVARLLGNA
jgi:chlorite dismutase